MEPQCLREGKAFHRKVQSDWETSAEGKVEKERPTGKVRKRPGRIDIFVSSEGSEIRAIVEIKNSDWDKMKPAAVRRNVKRQARQVWRYINSEALVDGICPGIVFPTRPRDPERMQQIEAWFEEEGIPVVWEDESAAERKAR